MTKNNWWHIKQIFIRASRFYLLIKLTRLLLIFCFVSTVFKQMWCNIKLIKNEIFPQINSHSVFFLKNLRLSKQIFNLNVERVFEKIKILKLKKIMVHP